MLLMRLAKTIVFCVCLSLFLAPPVALSQASPTPIPVLVSPERIDAFLCSQRCTTETVTLSLPVVPIPELNQLDVLLVIDITGSMGDELGQVQDSAVDIARELLNTVPDVRLGVGVISSYSDGLPWALVTDFTANFSSVQADLNSIGLLSGGDESYGRGLWESARLAWRDEALKLLVLFGDEGPLDPDPGPDEFFGTGDDIAFASAIADLAAREIRFIGVQSGSPAQSMMESIADVTGGRVFALSSASEIPSRLLNEIDNTIIDERRRQEIYVSLADEAQADWLSSAPTSLAYPSEGGEISFEVEICPSRQFPSSLARGNYPLSIEARNRNEVFGTIEATIDYWPKCVDWHIADTPSDQASTCSDADGSFFWAQPAIRIETASGLPSERMGIGDAATVVVTVSNQGPEASDAATVALYQSDALLPLAFPDGWTLVGEQTLTLASMASQELRFAWTRNSNAINLRAIVTSEQDPALTPEDVACESNIAQLSQVPLYRDNPSLEVGYVSALQTLSLPPASFGLARLEAATALKGADTFVVLQADEDAGLAVEGGRERGAGQWVLRQDDGLALNRWGAQAQVELILAGTSAESGSQVTISALDGDKRVAGTTFISTGGKALTLVDDASPPPSDLEPEINFVLGLIVTAVVGLVIVVALLRLVWRGPSG